MFLSAQQLAQLGQINPGALQLVCSHKSPDFEASFAKNIKLTPENIALVDAIAKIIPLRRRYRGPRAHRAYIRGWFNARSFCLQRDATSVALYLK